MSNKTEKLTSVRLAKKKMLSNIKKTKTEIIDILESEGRILAENIYSKINIPEFNNSAVDGYGFKNDLSKFPTKFKIVGESKPGCPFTKKIKKGSAIRVFTGAYIIDKVKNIDTICMEEDCEVNGDELKIRTKLPTGSNIRKKGEDVKKNTRVFSFGRKIRSVDLAQISSLGIKKIKVYKKVKVGIFSSGDELCKINSFKKKFQIYDSNKLALIALFKRVGCKVIDLGIIKDSTLDTQKKILKQNFDVDILVTSGGISKSKTDKIQSFLHEKGKIFVWRLSIKPGRPFAFGEIKNIPFIGLPGNPVAAIITFFMLVIEYVKKMSGCTDNQIIERVLPSNFAMKKKKGRREWLRGLIIRKKNQYFLDKFPTTGSGIISSISKSEGIIEIEEEKEYIKKGTLLKFFRYEDLLT
ncbi:MAG: molybdopterin molybdotransferase MoeA [Pseudomonadota bacterium]|nr:molybdopterin molybdotransferase MoeA [Pseudomonadota bacterium]